MARNKRSGSGKRPAGKQRMRVVVREIVHKSERTIAPPPKDMVEARKSISDVVRVSAIEIIEGLIGRAKSGEVSPAKYLFEMVGLFPATEETSSKPEDSLAYTLLQRMGLEPEPVEEESANGAN
jgi:hypothetical protein